MGRSELMLTMRRLAALSSVFGLLCMMSPPLHSQTVIKLGTIAPEQSIWHDALLSIRQQWRDISNGEVELRIYAGGVLGGEDELVRKMQRRGVDAVAISGAGLPLIHDVVSCLDVPLLFKSYEQLARVREAVAEDLESRIETEGYKVLGWAEAGWVRFFAKEPVRVPEDLRRQRLWISTGSPGHEQLLNQFGFRVVPLPVTDMLTGLQTGLIDAIDVPPLFALVDRSFQEARFMTDLDFAPLNSAVVISLAVWERLPEGYHEDFIRSVREAIAELRAGIRNAEREAIEEMRARGLELVSLNDGEVAEWQSLARSVYPELVCGREYPALFERVLALQREDAAR